MCSPEQNNALADTAGHGDSSSGRAEGQTAGTILSIDTETLRGGPKFISARPFFMSLRAPRFVEHCRKPTRLATQHCESRDQSQKTVADDSSIRAVTHAVALRLCDYVPAGDLGLASEAIAWRRVATGRRGGCGLRWNVEETAGVGLG